jgi:hypothetical protein
VAITAIRWSDIQAFYDDEFEVHRARVRDIGLDVPADVFEQLFHEPHADPLFASVVHLIDWAGVTWRQVELSGLALSEVHVLRGYEHAVEEARWRTEEQGLQDERPEVVAHWGMNANATHSRRPRALHRSRISQRAARNLKRGMPQCGGRSRERGLRRYSHWPGHRKGEREQGRYRKSRVRNRAL